MRLHALVSLVLASCFSITTGHLENGTWNAAEGMILLKAGDLALGFTTTSCVSNQGTGTCLVLSIFFQGRNGGALSDRKVWMANRERPVVPNSQIEFGADGNLVLTNIYNNQVVWSSNTSGLGAVVMELNESGNFVLLTANGTEVWSSFDHPTDALLPGQELRLNMTLQSSVSCTNSTPGMYSVSVEESRVVMKVQASPSATPRLYGIWSGKQGSNWSISSMVLKTATGRRLTGGKRAKAAAWIELRSKTGSLIDRVDVPQPDPKATKLLFLQLEESGAFKVAFDNASDLATIPLTSGNAGNKFRMLPGLGPCNLPLRCRPLDICSREKSGVSCTCSVRGGNGECLQPLKLKTPCNDPSSYTFVTLKNTSYFLTRFIDGVPLNSSRECQQLCLRNCSCSAAVFRSKKCFQISEVLNFYNVSSARKDEYSVTFLKVNKPGLPTSRSAKKIWVLVSVGLLTGILLVVVAFLLKNRHRVGDELLDSIPGLPRRFSYRELSDATAKFGTKLGSGAFGSVYQGSLEDGTKVAVKRLESDKRGDEQFRAEVITIASVHHNNLVRLIGFCQEHKHTMLVYEFMPNGSLDKWIFGSEKSLSWATRFTIGLDIARGLAYLHDACEQSILHLDIKPQNILLDVQFKAKISDFGLSLSATKGMSCIVGAAMRGTPGYMAPEIRLRRVSKKIDVYSFGIVLLEMVSAKHAVEFLETMFSEQLMLVEKVGDDDEQLVQLLDPRLRDCGSCSGAEVVKVIKVALCCIQDEESRPSMGDVVKMLEGNLMIPTAQLSFNHRTTLLPMGIASFIASLQARTVTGNSQR